EDKYFYLYLLTNRCTTQTGIYKITNKRMAYDLGYSIESVSSLIKRFISTYKLIRYNPETRELAIKNWGKYNLDKGGKPMMDCIISELKGVEDLSLIQYVSESIQKQEIRSLYESFCRQEQMFSGNEDGEQDETNTYINTEIQEFDDTLTQRYTIGGQKEEEEEKEKQRQQQQQEKAPHPNIEYKPVKENAFQNQQNDVKEIIEFWDGNGFGFSNVNAKQQLLAWLDDSSFLQPKAVILKAMNIACANNKRRLNYVVGILKNWTNESLLTVEEIDAFQEDQKSTPKFRQSTPSFSTGRAIPDYYVSDLSDGEDE
ncbi:DnaD domain protein, partial [Neobacillus niacini]|uniref:DnaD domain-containing protein n=1 Tax=Neobacillus niacini TaxID=86668 RepID=UPI002FFDB760